MDDFSQIVGDISVDSGESLKDAVVNVFLVSGDIIPLKNWDAEKLAADLEANGKVALTDPKGTRLHIYREGVAAIAAFSRQSVDEVRKKFLGGAE